MPRVVIVSASKQAATFSYAQRLHRPEEFSAVLKTRRVLSGDCFDLHFRPVKPEVGARLGLIVPKRLAKSASLRNAIKRQGREVFRLMAFKGIPACDLVLRLNRPLKEARARDDRLRQLWRLDIESLLRRIPTLTS